VAIPKSTALMLLTMHGVLQDAHFAAAAQFKPERWLEAAAVSGCPHNAKAFVPFGAGPRFCPGHALALVEIKMVMTMLCSTFELSKPARSGPVAEKFSFTMMPRNLSILFRGQKPAAR
jgi:cytochrome P450